MKRKEKDCIRITYNAKPNTPNKLCHKFPIHELTEVRTRKFDIKETEKAWKFLLDCSSPITKFTQILFAFGYKRSRKILSVMDDGILSERGKWKDTEYIEEIEMVDLKYALNLT